VFAARQCEMGEAGVKVDGDGRKVSSKVGEAAGQCHEQGCYCPMMCYCENFSCDCEQLIEVKMTIAWVVKVNHPAPRASCRCSAI
jgi:hypothetical protein